MELKEYLMCAKSTMMQSCNNFAYLFLNLQAEVGEASEKSNFIDDKLADELGDCWWQSVVLFDFMQIEMPQPKPFIFVSKESCFRNIFESMQRINGIIAKAVRKNIVTFIDNNLHICILDVKNGEDFELRNKEFQKMFANIKNELLNFIQLFYNLLHVCGFDLNVIMEMNIAKLAKRKQNNEIINHG